MKTVTKPFLQVMLFIAAICICSSCSGDDYVNVIPGNSNALVSVDMKGLEDTMGHSGVDAIKSLFGTDNADDCGIDFASKVFFFETTDGNMGCCAKVSSSTGLADWLNGLAGKGICKKVTERRDIQFTLLRGSWTVCFNDKALLIMGPVLPAQQAEAVREMSRWLKQSEEDGVKGTPVFDKLQGIETPVAIVAQMAAMPEKFVAPFTIGAPKGADASQLLIAASITFAEGGNLLISGEPFSFNAAIDKALKNGTKNFRSIGGKYADNLTDNTLCSLFMNVKGTELVKMMHDSAALGVLLAGMNTVIDMDNILRSVDGDMVIGVNSYSESNMNMTMAAQLSNHDFLEDVDYWKKSCPAGSTIEDCGTNRFCFKNGETHFWFGVSEGNEFYGSTDRLVAASILKPSASPLPSAVRDFIRRQRFCMVLNVGELMEQNKELGSVADVLSPVFGNVNKVIYCIK